MQDRASDIHVEPAEKDLRIRFRIDGVLHEVMHSPKSIQAGVISRLKVMSEINIAERRLPQDGRMSLTVGGKPVDLRVATLPTVFGEKVVMRILDKGQALLSMDDQGFLPDVLERYESSYRKPYGTILVTGPTGSGKSTTLYATLNILNEVSRNIITIEDPVEYRLPGINQMQINSRAGLSFAAALRSILRADPDVLLVGEIRDRDTATIAVEASLTGHLVLTTLHTNDAASTPQRLVEMGVEPFLVTSALDCVLAQRLARKLCDRCKEQYQPSEAELFEAGWPMEQIDGTDWPVLCRSVGCGGLRQDRLPGPVRAPRGHVGDGGDREADHRAPLDRRPQEGRHHGRDDPAALRRAPQGRRRRDQPRRDLPGRHVIFARLQPRPSCADTGLRRHSMLSSQSRVLGEFLIDRHVLSRDDLAIATAESRRTGDPLPAVLHRNGLVGEKDLERGHRRDGRPAVHRLHRVPDAPGRGDDDPRDRGA